MSTRFIATCVLMLIMASPLYADFLVLKKKKILVGKFINATDTAYVFDGGQGEKEVPKYDVARLVIGYDGIPVCFQSKRSKTPNCKGTLFLLDNVRAVMGFKQPKKDEWYMIRMRLSSLTFLRMKKSTLDPALMPVIASGVRMRVFLDDDQQLVGELLRARGNMIEIRKPDGTRERIKRGEIQAAELLLPGRELDFIPEPPKSRGWWIFGWNVPDLEGLADLAPSREWVDRALSRLWADGESTDRLSYLRRPTRHID